jgi:tRNA(Ile2)-agmatinylcytidine synthase
MTEYAKNLVAGDKVCVGGGIRKASRKHSRILNVEFFQVLGMEKKHILANPMCTKCKKHMKSKGRGQGFECVRCGKKSPKKETKQVFRQIRKQIYIPQMSAHRHLTRPQQRLGIANKESAFDDSATWFYTNQN